MSIAAVYVIILAVLTCAYVVILTRFQVGLRKIAKAPRVHREAWPCVSVVLPARNEAEVLERTLESLLKQDYPGTWEIVVVDDRSTDQTPRILERLCLLHDRLKAITITEANPRSPKKNALARGITSAVGEIIVTTDADCIYDPRWLRGLVSYMGEDVGVVAGLTVFDLPVKSIPVWQRIQWLDFFVQNFLAAATVGAGMPSSCNGSNLAYRRRVYDEISGFGESQDIVSGDDVLFAQRVTSRTRWRMVFASSAETTVKSLPVLSVREVFHQRFRWASKGLAYRRTMSVFLFGVYGYYALLLGVPVVALFNPDLALALLGMIGTKLLWDFAIIRSAANLFEQQHLLPYFLPFSVLHLLLSPVFGLGGLVLPYRWKGDWYRTARLPSVLRRRLTRAGRTKTSRQPAESPI